MEKASSNSDNSSDQSSSEESNEGDINIGFLNSGTSKPVSKNSQETYIQPPNDEIAKYRLQMCSKTKKNKI